MRGGDFSDVMMIGLAIVCTISMVAGLWMIYDGIKGLLKS